jgi:hypothetical protein
VIGASLPPSPHFGAPSRSSASGTGEAAHRIYRERFRIANGSGYDSRYCEFDVVRVSGPDVVGPELFAYLGAEQEVTSYLIARGETS